MISKTYLALLFLSLVFGGIVYIAASSVGDQTVMHWAIIYTTVLPIPIVVAIIYSVIFCQFSDARAAMCAPSEVEPPFKIFRSAIVTYVIGSIVSTIVWSATGTYAVGFPHSQELTYANIHYNMLLQVSVGTMEEGTFRIAPMIFAAGWSFPLQVLWMILWAILFGISHLWAYGSMITTLGAVAYGVVMAFSYLGLFEPLAPKKCQTGIAMAHTLNNFTLLLAQLTSWSAIPLFVLFFGVWFTVFYALAVFIFHKT